MTTVKGDSSAELRIDDFEPKHLGFLLGQLSRRMRRDMVAIAEETGDSGRFDPLTASSFRLLSVIPEAGARITDVARLAGMTKQALGQYVAMLEPLGYLESTQDPLDRRTRIIKRTTRGDDAVATTNRLYEHLDDQWAGIVGPRRWATFRSVMLDLAVGWDGGADAAEPRGPTRSST